MTDMISASTTQMSKRYGLIYVDLDDLEMEAIDVT